MKIEIEIGDLSLDQIESLVAFLKTHKIPHSKQPILDKTHVSGCTEYLEQLLNRVEQHNAATRETFVRQQTYNDAIALRRVLGLIREYKPV